MRGINSILFIADNGPDEADALQRAVALSRYWHARLLVLDVMEVSALEGEVLRQLHQLSGLQARLCEARQQELEAMVAPYLESGVEIRVRVVAGRLHQEALRTIRRGGHKLLIKAARGPAQQPRAVGPMDARLISLAPCPVMIVREYPPGPVLASVALDGARRDAGGGDDRLLRMAHSVAHMEQLPLHLAHAWELPDARVLRAVSSSAESELLRNRIEGGHRELLEALLARHPDIVVSPHLLEGWASHTVPRLIDELQAGLLVIGAARQESGECHAVGSVLTVILHQVACSILVMK